MKKFFKQIFKKNDWEHFSHENPAVSYTDKISDFTIIAINFISLFLLGWLVSKDIIFGIIIGAVFAFLAMIKCYYEFTKDSKKF